MPQDRPSEPVVLEELLAEAEIAQEVPEAARRRPIADVEYDSRRTGKDYLFFAFAGQKTDGARYASEALARGAAGVVSESPAPEGFPGLWIRAPHGRRALALMARRLYRNAAQKMIVTGATGTNGKTTTCYLLDAMLRGAGHVTALAGTVAYHVAGRTWEAVNTTPESVDLYRMFAELDAAGGRHVTMEVSSHALAVGRVHGIDFRTTIFTNLTRDHLDFHKDMEQYFAAKSLLFRPENAPSPKFAVLNCDDPWASKIPLAEETEVIRYGLSAQAELRAADAKAGFEGLRFGIEWKGNTWEAASPLAGRVNVYNILAAFGAGLALGLEANGMLESVKDFRAAPGRFEKVDEGQPFLVLVDYAHTDDALRGAIAAARGLGRGRVITLFGCGGDRDRTKRPLMGQAAGEASDVVVLTSDNPRSEDPLDIMNDALVGLRRTDVKHFVEPDRAKAIGLAMAEARPGDMVLLAGKGHETYQVFKEGRIHFDDREVARQVLRDLGYAREEKR